MLPQKPKREHFEKLKGIICTKELNKGIKRPDEGPSGWRFQVPAEVARAGLEAPG